MAKATRTLRKIWWFIWEDDSLLSWAINIILAFILIKYLVYPGLGLLLGTSFPVVAVVSGSMEHDGSFDDWWTDNAICSIAGCTQNDWYNEHGITKDEFTKFIFKNGFNTGDIIILLGTKVDSIEIGDVIVFQSTKPFPIIHRVVEINGQGNDIIFETKGDHNPTKGPDDLNINSERLIGKAVVRIPYLGWIKIGFFRVIESIFGVAIG